MILIFNKSIKFWLLVSVCSLYPITFVEVPFINLIRDLCLVCGSFNLAHITYKHKRTDLFLNQIWQTVASAKSSLLPWANNGFYIFKFVVESKRAFQVTLMVKNLLPMQET